MFSETSYGDEDGNGERWVEVISWEPRAVVYHNFLVSLCFSLWWFWFELGLRLVFLVRHDKRFELVSEIDRWSWLCSCVEFRVLILLNLSLKNVSLTLFCTSV